MGQNKRYGGGIDRAIDTVAVRPKPIRLTDAELDLEHHPVRRAAEPVPVTFWVRFPEVSIRPDGYAVAYTDKSVLVRFEMMGGVEHEVWVWASAVQRQELRDRR